MASAALTPRSPESQTSTSSRHRPRSRPQSLRVQTFSESNDRRPEFNDHREGLLTRNKSTGVFDSAAPSPRTPPFVQDMIEEDLDEQPGADLSPRSSLDTVVSDESLFTGSPESPLTNFSSPRTSIEYPLPSIVPFDFSKIDYELERAKKLGEGLWSTVYLAEQKASRTVASSPSLPRRLFRKPRAPSAPLLFAVKTPIRQDAKDVFLQEARILSRLQRDSSSRMYIVPFYGFDARCDSLVFEAVIGGSLDDLCNRLKQMTEVARHLEVINLFPGIAYDLIGGLEFMHASGVVHADIKPANVLLDVSQHASQQKSVIRARYIDFSAAFIPSDGDGATNAGGTWDFMAPEQLRIQKELNTPTTSSDIWSLGITLLTILVGGSPYTAACGGNNFMLREAIKGGDPIGFARMDSVPRKRLAACQDFVDCCRLALKKEREKRVTASAWMGWLEECEWVDGDPCTGGR